MIIEKVDSNAGVMNLHQSKAFYWVDHSFLEAVLSKADFRLHFRSWIRFLYASRGIMVEVDSSRLSIVAHVVRPWTGNVPAQVEGEPGPILPNVTWFHGGCQVHCIRWQR